MTTTTTMTLHDWIEKYRERIPAAWMSELEQVAAEERERERERERLRLRALCEQAAAEKDAEIQRLTQERDEARAGNAKSVCVFCGTITPFPNGPDTTPEERVRVMWEHAEGCEKRPERRLADALDAANTYIKELEQAAAERNEDFDWALERVTRLCGSAFADAQVYRQKLLKGFGYPNEVFRAAQDYRALSIVLAELQRREQAAAEALQILRLVVFGMLSLKGCGVSDDD